MDVTTNVLKAKRVNVTHPFRAPSSGRPSIERGDNVPCICHLNIPGDCTKCQIDTILEFVQELENNTELKTQHVVEEVANLYDFVENTEPKHTG